MHRTHLRRRVAPALLWLACTSCAWADAGAPAADLAAALEVEVIATGRAHSPAVVEPDAPAVDRIVDLRLPATAGAAATAAQGTDAGPASPITYTGLDALLGDDDGATGTFDYTALPRDLDDDARWEPASERKARGIDATVSVAAGTGGMMQTSASVTVPMLDDRLTIRISGARGKGDGYLRDFSRDRMDAGAFGAGAWDGPGLLDRRRHGDDDFSRLGIDLRWTPSPRIRDPRP